VIGLALILLSIPGIVLPVFQFWVLVIPGLLLLLGPEHRASRWMLAKLRRTRARLRLRRMTARRRAADAKHEPDNTNVLSTPNPNDETRIPKQ